MTKAKAGAPSRNYSKTTLKILFGQSGNQCAEPQCSRQVIAPANDQSEAANVAHIAHIYAFSQAGPRGKAGMTQEQLNHPDNLILLCPSHHTDVDTQHESYPADLLIEWKRNHIAKFSDRLVATISDVGYAELEIAARTIMSGDVGEDGLVPSPSLPMAPAEKINHNNLSQTSTKLLKMGAAMSHEVEAMLRRASQLEPSFPDRLREGFQTKYKEYMAEGFSGDSLFSALYTWAGGSNLNPVRASAGLCLLTHLFILCDVFESEEVE